MLYWMSSFADTISVLNVFRYLTVRTGGATVTALIFVFWLGPSIIDLLRLKQGKGQPIRLNGPAPHLLAKNGPPPMGGLMILSALLAPLGLGSNRLTRW